jgi:nicotinate-nucleotide adenylyltransferase
MTDRPRLGLFGGSFNPVHMGHLIMAEYARASLGLHRVLFAPAGNPPHKSDLLLAPIQDRLAMVEAAIAGNDGFASSDLDIDRDEPSFTWQLLERLGERHPQADLWFIMGGDSLADFHTWSRPDRILDLARLAVVRRPGVRKGNGNLSRVPGLRNRIDHIDAPLCDISATDIRERIASGRSVRYVVPEPVRVHIEAHTLYR